MDQHPSLFCETATAKRKQGFARMMLAANPSWHSIAYLRTSNHYYTQNHAITGDNNQTRF